MRNFAPEQEKIIPTSRRNFLWSGRDTKVKNLTLLMEVATEVKASHPEFELEVVQNLPHSELLARIRSAYAVIQPSLSDVCPNFVLEAASLGKPFVLTRETGLRELLPEGGIFINPLDRVAIKEAILTMLKPDQYNMYGRQITACYQPRGWAEVAEDFLKI